MFNENQLFMNKQQKIKLIKETCCKAMGTKWKDVNTANRTDALAKTRHLIMFFLWRYTRLGLKEIGLEFKHPFKPSSVIYCRNTVATLLDNWYADTFSTYLNIEAELRAKGIEPIRLTFKQFKQ